VVRGAALYAAGLALGSANAVRHRVRGYRTPRPFVSGDRARARAYNEKVVARWETKGGIAWSGRRVLELGPGPDLGTGEIILERGAASYLAVDIHPLVEEPRLPYLLTSYPDMVGVEGPFDLIVSNAALEHFDDVPGTFRRLRMLAASDCMMVHHVDAKTHMRWLKEIDPLNILRYGDTVYRFISFSGAPNRLRASDYAAAAEAAGFSANIVTGRVADERYVASLRLARSYHLDDLRLLTFTLRASCLKR
jgi:hypothetical protein